MWHVIAEEDTRCTECSHTIPSGALCLSQMPPVMPEHFRRKKYENFCIDCTECDAGKPSCYARWLNHWYARGAVREPLDCAHCGSTIPGGTFTAAQTLYAWPASENDLTNSSGHLYYGAEPGAVAGTAFRSDPVDWSNLSPDIKSRFTRHTRSPKMAQRLFEKEIPASVRARGESAVRELLKDKHISDQYARSRYPDMAKYPSNKFLEDARTNMSRGNRTVSKAERASAAAQIQSDKIKGFSKGLGKAGIISAALEAVVSIPENVGHYVRGRKSRKKAALDTGIGMGTAAATGSLMWGVSTGSTALGIGISLGPLGTPLQIAGVALLTGTAAYRIHKAWERDLPLDEYRIFFCKDTDCKDQFAENLSRFPEESSRQRFPWLTKAVTIGLATVALSALLALSGFVAWSLLT